jgi:glycine/D-amino acid oxidase-like deaminating enzyme
MGAGISGLSAAFELSRLGASVAVLEARHVAAGASGYNTAKLSSLHGLTYSKLERQLGAEKARLYGAANERGIERIHEIVGELGIDCDLRRKPNLVYTESEDERRADRGGGGGGATRVAPRPGGRGDGPPLPGRRRGAIRAPG